MADEHVTRAELEMIVRGFNIYSQDVLKRFNIISKMLRQIQLDQVKDGAKHDATRAVIDEQYDRFDAENRGLQFALTDDLDSIQELFERVNNLEQKVNKDT